MPSVRGSATVSYTPLDVYKRQHLHDSVLQTLGAIKQRSGPGSDVARLARGQERDLREWLFRTADGAPPADREALDAELRQHAATLEAEHAVRFEVISVGARRAVPGAIAVSYTHLDVYKRQARQ